MNLPNILATLRIALAPLMFFFLIERDHALFANVDPSWLNYFAALIFVIASVTDFFDGYIARQWNQQTKLGAILDPLADKMLTLAAFIGLTVMGVANAWAIFIILCREFFITGLRVVAASEGRQVAARAAGKAKTFSQMMAIGFLMMGWPYGELLLWIATALTLYSGAQYVNDYIKGSSLR